MIKTTKTSQYDYQRSKFLGFIVPVQSLEEVKKSCEQLKKEHNDAHQFCYAYRLAYSQQERFYDDQEPNKASGYVIYQLMVKQHVTNCLIVVIRYKAGPNLGLNHLKRSYLACAKPLLDNNLIPFQKTTTYQFEIPYSHQHDVNHFCIANQIQILNQTYLVQTITYNVSISLEGLQTLQDFLTKLNF